MSRKHKVKFEIQNSSSVKLSVARSLTKSFVQPRQSAQRLEKVAQKQIRLWTA